jgi:hypothetical protein
VTTSDVEGIATNPSLSVPEKSRRIAHLLGAQPDHGVATAVEVLLTTEDERVAAFVSDYLALVPDARQEKTRAAERLRTAGPLVLAASRLVPWLPPALVDGFVTDYLKDPDPRSSLFSVMFEISTFWPERLRRHGDRIEHPSLQRGMLSGAPDPWVDDLVARWHDERDPDLLDSIARIRTDRAVEALLGLREEVDDPPRWEGLVEMAGRLPDRGERSWYRPAFLGSLVERAAHVMGGPFAGDVPLCPMCEAPAERVLTLDSASIEFGLTHDPSFFWYTCDCGALDFTTVQLRPDGLRAFYVPQGGPSPGGKLVPGERGMLLEPHPNQTGVSIDATGGFSQHQVGGPPRWIEPRLHPRCPLCGTVMRFVASIDSGLTLFGRLGFRGILYGFWCDTDAVADTRHQG